MGRVILMVGGDCVWRRRLVLGEVMAFAKCSNLCAAGIDFPIKLKLRKIKKYTLRLATLGGWYSL